jgi:hypothetical protein
VSWPIIKTSSRRCRFAARSIRACRCRPAPGFAPGRAGSTTGSENRRRADRPDLSRLHRPRSIICGFIAIEIIGLNMWASVNWSPIEVRRQSALAFARAAGRNTACRSFPAAEGGRLVADGRLLPDHLVLLWWARTYRARARSAWAPMSPGPSLGDLALSGAGLHPPDLMGSWSEAVPFGIFPHLDWTNNFSITHGNLFYNPFHCSRSRSCTARRCCSPCTARPSWR